MPKSALRYPLIFILGLFLLHSCVFYPFAEYLSNDIVTPAGVIATLTVLQYVTEVLGLSAIIGFIIHAVYRYGVSASYPLFLLSGGALLLKQVLAIIAKSVIYGSLDLTADYTSIIVAFLVELLQCALVIYIAYRLVGGLLERKRELQKAAERLGVPYEEEVETLPFKGFLHRNNPLQRTALWATLILLGFRVLSLAMNIIADYSFYGNYRAEDILYWLLVFALEVVLPLLGAYPMMLLCMHLTEKQAKKK